MERKLIFLASSSELESDRDQLRIMVGDKNKDWTKKNMFLELVVWEDFLDAMSKTRLQDEYNKVILKCDIFILLFFTKVGSYTQEEFEKAFKQFKETNRPFIFTYFKDAAITTGKANKADLTSLWNFQEKLAGLGHFYTVYNTTSDLLLKINNQLDKLSENEFIKLEVDDDNNRATSKINFNSYITQLRLLTSEHSHLRKKVEELNARLEDYQKQQVGNKNKIFQQGLDEEIIARDIKGLIAALPNKYFSKTSWLIFLFGLILCLSAFLLFTTKPNSFQNKDIALENDTIVKKTTIIPYAGSLQNDSSLSSKILLKKTDANIFREKVKSFDLNPSLPKMKLRFTSRTYDLTFSFDVSRKMTLQTLLKALIIHFSLDNNITKKNVQEDETISYEWIMYVNYKEVKETEYDKTVSQLRMKPDDIISIKKVIRTEEHRVFCPRF